MMKPSCRTCAVRGRTCAGAGPLTPCCPRSDAVDERDWLACGDPDKMLRLLQHRGKLTGRKARLFACACCRRIWHLLADGRLQEAVEAAEAHADADADAGAEAFPAAYAAALAAYREAY